MPLRCGADDVVHPQVRLALGAQREPEDVLDAGLLECLQRGLDRGRERLLVVVVADRDDDRRAEAERAGGARRASAASPPRRGSCHPTSRRQTASWRSRSSPRERIRRGGGVVLRSPVAIESPITVTRSAAGGRGAARCGGRCREGDQARERRRRSRRPCAPSEDRSGRARPGRRGGRRSSPRRGRA